ncbi:MAG: HAMP domain-containing protein [Betaproteobacteria bacterium]
MSILNPAIRLVGSLSFRNKLKATALIFGVPLLVALGVILAGVGARVSAVQSEREALAVQVPAITLLTNLHQYLAANQALLEGAEQLTELTKFRRESTAQALKVFESSLAEHKLSSKEFAGSEQWLETWKKDFQEADTSDASGLSELHSRLMSSIRSNLDKLNEKAGLLVDGDASNSRLINVLTSFVPELIDTTGKSARLGATVLVKKSLKSSRRTELTLLRGKFDSLVEWSMDGLQKVSGMHPEAAAGLDNAGSRLNTAYLGIQEALTTKMLDTIDFDMMPEAFLNLTQAALDESLVISGLVFKESDALLTHRLTYLQAQFYAVVAVIVLILSLVIAGFISAYISIMRGLNSLSHAVNTMASGDLEVRVEISTSDEIGCVGTQFNQMVESLAERTALLREKTNDIQNMLHHMPQGILTIVEGGVIHPEYSDYLETIFETRDVKGQSVIDFIFANGNIGSDVLSQVEASTFACIGEDRMNFEFNSHLLIEQLAKTMPDGRIKYLELSWSPICSERDTVEKIMVCVRDVTELRQLEAEAEVQKRELQMIGQILAVNQEKFHEFVESSRQFVADNEALLLNADDKHPELITQLFRNMHTIKGNARTYGLLHLTNIVHEAEQAYDDLRKNNAMSFQKEALLSQLQEVMTSIEEYASLNEVKLGRKGPGRRGSAEKYVMVQRTHVENMLAVLESIDLKKSRPEQLVSSLQQITHELRMIGTESIKNILDGVFESLPALAKEMGKETPKLMVNDNGLAIRNQISNLLRNVFMHLYRNSMDHGLEEVSERCIKGKHPTGTIQLDLAIAQNRLVIRLKDDGKGLALGYIRSKGIEKGLITEGSEVTDEEIARLIFAAGFSTASSVTEVSGRGVGMDAVQDFIKREGGEICLRFTDDQTGADYRAFETVISLPECYAVSPVRHHELRESCSDAAKMPEYSHHSLLADIRSSVSGLVFPGKIVTESKLN